MKKNILKIVVVSISCMTGTIFVAYNYSNTSYKLLCLLPISFYICYILFFSRNLNNIKEFNYTFVIVAFCRYVIMPVLIVLGGRYTGRSPVTPNTDSFNRAFILMIYELVVCSISIYVMNKKLMRNKNKITEESNIENLQIPQNYFIYFLFIFIVLISIFIRPNTIKAFNFISPKEKIYNYNDFKLIDQIIILATISAKQFIFLILMIACNKKYKKTNKKIYIILSAVFVVLNCIFYFGSNRSDFILNLITSAYLFGLLYKKYIKVMFVSTGVIGVSILMLITQARTFQNISEGQNKYYEMADNFQAYLGGPYNVALAIETLKEYPQARSLKTLAYDFTRSTLGLNIFVRNINWKSADKFFNMRMYYSDHTAQILPMIGEGYIIFGDIFSPLIEIFFICLVLYLKKICMKQNRIELIFFFTITLVRLGFIMCQNSSIQMNDLSFNLFLPITIISLNNKIGLKKQQDNNKNLGVMQYNEK